MHGLIEPERLPDFLPYVRRYRHWQISRGVIRCQIKNCKNNEADRQQGRNGNQDAPDDILNQSLNPVRECFEVTKKFGFEIYIETGSGREKAVCGKTTNR